MEKSWVHKRYAVRDAQKEARVNFVMAKDKKEDL